ncbi:hypothetical protein [Nocardia sp. NPDC057227]|uniref:hypothetical protein n=1 Tax=Nocardia sp. NPDC057227 TaxID=3346056 RepID=UPI00362E8E55
MIPPIEIKINLGTDVDGVLGALGCADSPAVRRDVWFAESRTRGQDGALALLGSGIVIRLRSGDLDDLTVKLRPCRRSQLMGRWAKPFTDTEVEYRVEDDWCGQRRALTASVLGVRPPGSLAEVARSGVDVTAALNSAQRQFLVTCTRPGVALDHLGPVGPIAATRWTGVRLGHLDLDVERWTAGGIDLLELALRITPIEGETPLELITHAAHEQRGFEAEVRRAGFPVLRGRTKTQRVLTALVRRPIER